MIHNISRFIAALALLATAQGAWAWSGSGTAESPYQIKSTADLDQLATDVNSGTEHEGDYFVLTTDLTYSHETDWNDANSTENNYTPIGGYNNTEFRHFKGHFDGQSHTISGIRIYQSGSEAEKRYAALFGQLSNGAEVKNVFLADARITGYYYSGPIVGNNGGSVSNCHVLSDVTIHAVTASADYHGGIVGYNFGTITGCTSAASITAAVSCKYNGGITGQGSGTVEDCIYFGSTVAGDSYVGAIIGYAINGSTVSNCYYTSTTFTGKNSSGTALTNDASAIGKKTSGVTIDDARLATSDDFAVSGDTYTIGTAAGWSVMCAALYHNDTYNRFSGKTVRLDADITVTRMAGSQYHDFCGTFDGGGNTLTVTLSGSSDRMAPFSYISNEGSAPAAIRNLNVVADITSSGQKASALVGEAWGELTIEQCTVSGTVAVSKQFAGGIIGSASNTTLNISNCISSVTISSSTSGDGTHGGFAGHVPSSATLNISGCVFDGKIITTSGTTNCGGFVGHSENTAGSNVSITNSLYAPTADDQTVSEGCETFCRNIADGHITNSYYTRALGTAQGKATRTVAAAADVTIEAVALTGTATQYTVSGITAYSGGGLQRGETLYYGSGDQLSLTLSNSATGAPRGYQYAYTASAGTLSGTTLTMPDADVTISTALAPIDWATVNKGNPADPYMIYNKDQLLLLAHRVNGTNGETANTYQDKFFKLGADITFTHPAVEGDDYAENYEAIGGYIGGTIRYFNGMFDGDSHTVSGIRIRKTGSDAADSYQGLFGCISSGADIHDVHLTDARITGYMNVGGIAGSNTEGHISGCSVTDSYITATGDWNYGTICGRSNYTYRLTNNYYHGCTVNSTENATNVGCGGSEITDITANNGALPAYRLDLGANITTPPGTFAGQTEWLDTPPVNPRLAPENGFTLAGNHYFASGYVFTPGSTLASGAAQGYTPRATLGDQLLDLYPPTGDADPLAGKAIARLTITADCDGKTLASTEAIYSTGQPVTVAYIKADGTPGEASAIALDGTEGVLGQYGEETWYFVGAGISYSDEINCYDNVNIILTDGKTMTVTSDAAGIYGDGGTLTIYGQTLGTGTLDITATNSGIFHYDGNVVICGGTVNATGTNSAGINAYGDVTITGGQVTATNEYSEGIFAGGDITLGWTNATDFIKASSYYVGDGKSVKIASGQTLYDEDGNPYSGNYYDLAGKTLRPYDCRLALRDDADNTAAIADANGKVYNVTLQGRTLYKDGAWNTLCLPFALGDDQAESGHELDGTPLEGATLMTLGNSQACNTGFDPQTGTLNLDFLPATTVEPGVAYIVKWPIPDGMTPDDFAADYAANPDAYDLKNPVFTGVTVTNDAPADHATTSDDTYVTFIGTYGPAAIYADPAVNLYLGAANKLYWPTATDFELKPFRAYFQLNNGLTAGDPSNPNAARAFSLNFGDDEATGIISVHDAGFTINASAAWYTLDGRRLDAQPTAKGLYIHGGKKVIVK